MHQLLKGSKATVNGNTYNLVFNFAAIWQAEEELGVSLIAGLNGLGKDVFDHPPITLVCRMFYAAAKALQPKLTFDELRQDITAELSAANGPDSIVKLLGIWSSVVEAWFESMPEKTTEAEDSEVNPSQGQS